MAVVGDLALNFCYLRKNESEPPLDSRKKVFGVPVSCTQTVFLSNRRKYSFRVQSNVQSSECTKSFVELREKEKRSSGMRKTKLVCTIGPACCSLDELEKLAVGGMNVARLNMCHNSREWHRDVIRKIKKLNEDKGYCVSVMIDTEGSQMHVVDHGAPSSVKAEDGSTWLFTNEKIESSRPFTVQASHEGFYEGLNVGDEIVFDGGMATFEVVEKVANDLLCKCTDPGLLLPRAKLSFWRDGKLIAKNYELPTLSAKDWLDIEFAITEGVDFIAMSFVVDSDAVMHLKNHISTKSPKSIKVLAKIETLQSLHKLEEIVEASDGVMIARGDLGVEISLEQIPGVQEEITYLCRLLNKPVVVASQLLESMVEYPTPTRAEVADVSEVVRQHADALMLSGESAIGPYGQKALSVLHKTSNRMELSNRQEKRQNIPFQHKIGSSLADQIAEQICNSASEMADNLSVAAIFVYTRHGQMASLISRNRPNCPIFAFTDDSSTRMTLNLQWGVSPVLMDLSDDSEANISKSMNIVRDKGLIEKGDTVLVVSDIVPSLTTQPVFQSIVVSSVL